MKITGIAVSEEDEIHIDYVCDHGGDHTWVIDDTAYRLISMLRDVGFFDKDRRINNPLDTEEFERKFTIVNGAGSDTVEGYDIINALAIYIRKLWGQDLGKITFKVDGHSEHQIIDDISEPPIEEIA